MNHLTPPKEQWQAEQSEDFRVTEDLLSLLVKGAALRGYSNPEDYLIDLVEADLAKRLASELDREQTSPK